MNGVDEGISEKETSRSGRRVRPEVQIYRPGMLKRGEDITRQPCSPSESANERQEDRRESSRNYQKQRGGGGGYSRTFENSNRRRQSDEYGSESRGDSGGSTPETGRRPPRMNGHSPNSPHKAYNQNQRRDNRYQGDNRSDYGYGGYGAGGGGGSGGYRGRGGGNYRGTSSSYRERDSYSQRDDMSERSYDGSTYSGYNSTQSLLNPRQPGGYLDLKEGSGRGNREQQQPPSRGRGQHSRQLPRNNLPQHFDRNWDRASMRAENVNRSAGDGRRRRNDSINSTQSERPASMYVDESAKAAAVQQESATASLAEMCASFESMASMNWGDIVEQDMALEASESNLDGEARELKDRLLDEQQREESSSYQRGSEPRTVDRQGKKKGGILHVDLRKEGRLAGRVRRDSDSRSSSVADSIQEEWSDGDEPAEGERTPTYEQSYGAGDRRRVITRGAKENLSDMRKGDDDEYARPSILNRTSIVRRDRNEDRASPRKFIAKEGGRLKGRVSMNAYQPPAMRVQARSSGSSQSTPRASIEDDRESRLPSAVPSGSRALSPDGPSTSGSPPQFTDFPIYQEIQQNEGPKMADINSQVDELLPLAKRRDLAAVNKLLVLSESLSELFYGFIARDIKFTFAMNIESHLWKQAFYKIFEAFRTGCNSAKSGAKELKESLRRHLKRGIQFYERLISLYESEFSLSLVDCLLWPSGFPADDLVSVHSGTVPLHEIKRSSLQLAVKSLARLLICLGDLHRYLAVEEATEDFSKSRVCYLRAAHLWPSSGHSYNQLAVLAYNAMLYRSRIRMRLTPVHILSDQRQERVIDEMYFFVRALACSHSFDAARDRMKERLAAMLRKVDRYEPLLDKELGRAKGEAELALDKDRPKELWIRSDGNVDNKETAADLESVVAGLRELQASKLHRRAVSYMVACSAMLISKLAMEKFSSISERALSQLIALLQQPDTPMTSVMLVQLSTIFIYTIHSSNTTGDEDTCSVQQQLAVRFLITVWGIMLRPLANHADSIERWIRGEEEVPREVRRVLPGISVISFWLSSPTALRIYNSMPSVEPLTSALFSVDPWALLADLSNLLNKLDSEGVLPEEGAKLQDTRIIHLPELVLLSSFTNIFTNPPRPLYMQNASEDLKVLPVQCRLRQLFTCAECIDGSELHCFTFDEKVKRFVRRDLSDGDRLEQEAVSGVHDQLNRERVESEMVDQAPSDNIDVRAALLESEAERKRRVLVVCPTHLLPDTNAFVDHLAAIQRIVDSGRYTLLISTVVIDELTGLSLAPRPSESEEHGDYVNAQAKKAIAWVKEQCRVKNPKVGTLTSRGQRLEAMLLNEDLNDGMTMNDDRIVSSCASYCAGMPALPPSSMAQCPPLSGTPIHRSLVLLSEDRGVQIKAAVHDIPSRTLPSFMKWAGI